MLAPTGGNLKRKGTIYEASRFRFQRVQVATWWILRPTVVHGNPFGPAVYTVYLYTWNSGSRQAPISRDVLVVRRPRKTENHKIGQSIWGSR